jgi:hypothetical protein
VEGELTPAAMPRITATGIPTPIPTFAPVLKPPSLEGSGVGVPDVDGVVLADWLGTDVLEVVGVALDVVEEVVVLESSSEFPRVTLK